MTKNVSGERMAPLVIQAGPVCVQAQGSLAFFTVLAAILAAVYVLR